MRPLRLCLVVANEWWKRNRRRVVVLVIRRRRTRRPAMRNTQNSSPSSGGGLIERPPEENVATATPADGRLSFLQNACLSTKNTQPTTFWKEKVDRIRFPLMIFLHLCWLSSILVSTSQSFGRSVVDTNCPAVGWYVTRVLKQKTKRIVILFERKGW